MKVGRTHDGNSVRKSIDLVSEGIWTTVRMRIALALAHACQSGFSSTLWVQRTRELGTEHMEQSLLGPLTLSLY